MDHVFPVIAEVILYNICERSNFISKIHHLPNDSICFSGLQNRNVASVALLKPINESYMKRIWKEMFEEPHRRKRHHSTGETIFYETW